MIFKINPYAIMIIFISIPSLILIELFVWKDKKQFIKNYELLNRTIGGNSSIIEKLLLSIASGYSEELLFRVYLYQVFLLIFNKIIILYPIYDIIIISAISIIFGILHISQGKQGLIFGTLFSMIFFISIKISDCIWYAVFAHILFNFIQLTFVIEIQKKLYIKKSKNP